MSAVSANVNTDNSVTHDDHEHHDTGKMTVLAFWIYVMTDCIIFASFFVTYAVLVNNVAGGVSGKDIFDLHFVAIETFVIMLSSLTYSFAMVGAQRKSKSTTVIWLLITAVLGCVFIGMAGYEFHTLIAEGNGPDKSAFLTAFFSLVGLHLLHIIVGVIWMLVLTLEAGISGIEQRTMTRLRCLAIFWNFLDIAWVCVFSFVYLLGAM